MVPGGPVINGDRRELAGDGRRAPAAPPQVRDVERDRLGFAGSHSRPMRKAKAEKSSQSVA